MQRWHAFSQLVLARIREFYREPEALFWVYGFPLMLAIGLAIAYMSREPERPAVDVQDAPNRSGAEALVKLLKKKDFPVELHAEKECKERLVRGVTSMYVVIEPDKYKYVFDPTRAEGVLARHWVESIVLRARAEGGPGAEDDYLREPGTRYIDFLLPGLVGMNIMGGGLFGVGFVLVDMRVRKLLKRLLATPMHRGDFLLSLLATRMLFLAPEMLSLLLVGHFVLRVPIEGNILLLILVIFVGALAFAGIGLLVGCRTEKTETISGLINLVMLPMYLLSGVFFPSKRFPEAAQPFIQALPLTQLNDALRAVLQGDGLKQVACPLGILAIWAGVTFFLALRWFRWR